MLLTEGPLVVPIIFGALATWRVITQTAPVAGAVFTLLATVIPVAYRASRMDDAIRRYQRRSGDFTNLRDGFRRIAELRDVQGIYGIREGYPAAVQAPRSCAGTDVDAT